MAQTKQNAISVKGFNTPLGDGTVKSKFKKSDMNSVLPITALLGAVMLWGGSFAAMTTSLGVLSPSAVMWLRMVFGLVTILPFLPKILPGSYQPGDWKILIPTVLLQPCAYFFLESRALLYTTSSQAGIISACLPLMVALGAWLFLSEPLFWRQGIGCFLSIAGVVALTLLGSEGSRGINPLLGNALELAAMASAAANMILIKDLSNRYSPWTLTAMQVMAGTLFFLPGLGDLLQAPHEIWTLQLIFILIFLGVFVSLGAFGLFNWAISKISASKASSFVNLVPVTAVIIGWGVLGERLNFIQCVAAGVVIFGVLLSQKRH